MDNPFSKIDQRLCNIESLLLELKHSTTPQPKDVNLSVDEVAEFLKVSEQTVYTYIRKGIIPAEKVSRKFIISRAALDEVTKEVKSLKYQRTA